VETWGLLAVRDLPRELHSLYKVISHHFDNTHKLPTFEELQYAVRDSSTREKLYAVESIDVDVDASLLYQYLKNERVQNLALNLIETYVEDQIAFEDAEETVQSFFDIARDLEVQAELEHATESMQRIELFESKEELGRYLSLGLNREYDLDMMFSPRDLIMVGGYRGGGKSVVCSNVSNNVIDSGKSALYFTIEMHSREILQRNCAIATGISLRKLKLRNLSIDEWYKVAIWWANRFRDSEEVIDDYKKHRNFDKFHRDLTTSKSLRDKNRLDIVYDPELTLGKIQSEIDKRAGQDFGVICADYLNEVKLSKSSHDQYDWKEQIVISKGLKSLAQDYEIPVVTPYQISETGQARFSKAILVPADAAFVIKKHEESMEFTCHKMRNGPEEDFHSTVNWETLKIGPDTAVVIDDDDEESTGVKIEGGGEPPWEAV